MRLDDSTVRRLRSARPAVDPWRPLGAIDEEERVVGGGRRAARTVFLAGAECPFTCVFCDLWRHTTEGRTPLGALPRQLEAALADAPASTTCLKLYNASNFFDQRAVPPRDLPRLAALAAPFETVVVECHPKLVDERCRAFAARLAGELELALGLETAHPSALAALNKKMDLTDFARAAGRARDAGMTVRAFVLVGTPFVRGEEQVEWVVRSVRYALAQGVERVSLIPVRGGNGALEELERQGAFTPPDLALVEDAFSAALDAGDGAIVSLDLWDLDLHPAADCCAGARRERLRRIDRTGAIEPPVDCATCGGGG